MLDPYEDTRRGGAPTALMGNAFLTQPLRAGLTCIPPDGAAQRRDKFVATSTGRSACTTVGPQQDALIEEAFLATLGMTNSFWTLHCPDMGRSLRASG